MLENILRLQETILGKKRIGLCFSCEDGLYIHCNPEGMKKILINLLTNAVEAMEEEREGNQVSDLLSSCLPAPVMPKGIAFETSCLLLLC